MLPFANVKPVQIAQIPWGWTNETTSDGLIFVKEHPGEIRMPALTDYFDWTRFEIRTPLGESNAFDLGTVNMKSIFTTAARFLGYEYLLTEQPNLEPITWEFFLWNERLLETLPSIRYFVIGDDVASRKGLMVSPDTWRVWIRPNLYSLIDLGRRHGCQVIYHSDGDISEILPDLKDMGVFAVDGELVGHMPDALEATKVRFSENTDPFMTKERSHWK